MDLYRNWTKDVSKFDRKNHEGELLSDGDKGWTVALDPIVPLPVWVNEIELITTYFAFDNAFMVTLYTDESSDVDVTFPLPWLFLVLAR